MRTSRPTARCELCLRRFRVARALAVALVLAAAPAPSRPATALAHSEFTIAAPVHPVPVEGQGTRTALAHHGMVVSESALASDVGLDVLREGGNAVDAAVATAFALAVTLPSAGNLGGGGFLLYRSQAGDAVAYDFRETAPASAHDRMFLLNGQYREGLHHDSHLAVGVPGTVAGLHLAWQDHGRLPWKRLIAPAIRLADAGFIVSEGLARSLSRNIDKLSRHTAARAQFTRHGAPYRAGDLLRQPDLARTLQAVARRGPDGFYKGEVARRIEQEIAAHGGGLTRADLRAYRAHRRVPVVGTYRGFEVLSMPPPSSGGVVLIEMLNILERFDLAAAGPASATNVHLLVETMRRGFADRARHLGDPDFNPRLPLSLLLSKDHAATLRKTITPERASVSRPDAFEWPIESKETTHLSVMDSHHNAVALTYTLEQSYGSGIVAPGTGFLLNNEMGDFNAGPNLTDAKGRIGTPPNLVAPGKRMLSSMSPTILVKNGQPFLVLGSPGGRTIINTVLETIVNVVDHQMPLDQAVAAPRLHHQWLPDEILFEESALEPETQSVLSRWGHRLRKASYPQGSVAAIGLDSRTGQIQGVSDSRCPDGAATGW